MSESKEDVYGDIIETDDDYCSFSRDYLSPHRYAFPEKKITFNLIAPHDKYSFFVHTCWNKVHTELLFLH